jgi:hypothetical protein
MKDTKMNTPSIANLNDRLHDLAKARAAQLHQQAMDDFFDAAGHAAKRALRPASRLAASIARHSRLRRQVEA